MREIFPARARCCMQALEVDPNYVVARERLAELSSDSVEVAPQKGPRLAGLPQLHPSQGRTTSIIAARRAAPMKKSAGNLA